ncbi:MAG TPA: SDR family NAD(P)-dependent oxidoreductase [Anaerolineaceae bacterium]|nr:SDR family NAD(P)-dependent oxidoreductase [Anaerolineaceae bacterium]
MGLLDEKTALVTGSARGIGRAIAEAFAEQGAHVALADKLFDKAQSVAQGIKRAGYPEVNAFKLDIGDQESIQKTISNVIAAFGRIDILVNNAGIHRPHFIVDFPIEDWDLVYQINVRGTFLMIQAVARKMIEQGQGGVIINMSSASGKKPDPQGAAYCSSKSAIIGMTRVAALELGKYGIRVNAILPGATDTDMLRGLINDVPGLIEELVAKTPLGKMADPRDQANAAVFLASPLASHITGEGMVVSGGEFMDV